MNQRIAFAPKPAAETVDLIFDFHGDLLSGITFTAVVVSTLYSGTDTSPSSVISGTVSLLSFDRAEQTVTAGVAGNTYLLTCTASTSDSQILIKTGFLVVI